MNYKHPSLWEFFQIKKQLEQCLSETPTYEKKFVVFKHCKFPIGLTSKERKYVSLKPSSEIVVTISDGKCLNVKFFKTKRIQNGVEFPSYWEEDRLMKWASKYCYEV